MFVICAQLLALPALPRPVHLVSVAVITVNVWLLWIGVIDVNMTVRTALMSLTVMVVRIEPMPFYRVHNNCNLCNKTIMPESNTTYVSDAI